MEKERTRETIYPKEINFRGNLLQLAEKSYDPQQLADKVTYSNPDNSLTLNLGYVHLMLGGGWMNIEDKKADTAVSFGVKMGFKKSEFSSWIFSFTVKGIKMHIEEKRGGGASTDLPKEPSEIRAVGEKMRAHAEDISKFRDEELPKIHAEVVKLYPLVFATSQ